MKIFINGRILPGEDAFIRADDRGFTLGDGIFETMRAQAGRIHCMEAHFERLRRSADRLRIPLTLGYPELAGALINTLVANDLDTGDAALRLTLTRGPGPRGLPPPATPNPTLIISVAPAPKKNGGEIRACLVGIPRNEHSPLAQIKSINYLENILARMEAEARGADDALLCNLAGNLAETTVANLFLIIDGTALTPPLEDGPLPGVTRARILGLGDRLPCAVAERHLRPQDIAKADEAFLTNSLVGVQPLVAIDGNAVGNGCVGPNTRQIKSVYEESVFSEIS